MKKLVEFRLGDEIPEKAVFLIQSYDEALCQRTFVYEVPEIQKTSRPKDNHEETIRNIVDYLNEVTGSKYTTKSKATTSLIRARLNEGRSYEDFVSVIDKKADEWLDDPQWSRYLRPQTLFGTKFDSYLSQTTGNEMANKAFKDLEDLIND